MTVTLDIPPTLEATVQANAQARGVSIEKYLLTLVEGVSILALRRWHGLFGQPHNDTAGE